MQKDRLCEETIIFKTWFYIMSLSLLMGMLIFLEIDIKEIEISVKDFKINIKGLDAFLKNNVFSCVCMTIIFLGIVGYVIFLDRLKDAKRLPIVVQECESMNYENLSFLATYIIPLVCFPLDTVRQQITLFIVIFMVGCIFIRTNLYYTNPALILIGFNIYSVKFKYNEKLKKGIVIIKGTLEDKDSIVYLKLSDNVYFARRIINVHQGN